VDLAGVVSLATPQFPSKYYAGVPAAEDATPPRLRQIDEPKLFAAGTDDVQHAFTGELRRGVKSVRFALEARRMFDAADEPKELVLIDSSFHSSELLTTPPARIPKQFRGAVYQSRAAVLRFLSENS
jgi:hypothetical protein